MEEKKEFDLQGDFIDYWDRVVRQWLDTNADITSFTGDAVEQRVVIEAINKNCKGKNGQENPDYIINTMHIPEPYWGNPRKCSIVLLDYNPAGGWKINRHTTINCKDCDKCGHSFIRYVNSHKYSEFARSCPVLKEMQDNGMEWFSDEDNGYEGYQWWNKKRRWLDHLVEAICGKKDNKLPFGLELCGWHSKKWSNNMDWINEEREGFKCRGIINQRAIQPLFAAMKNSLEGSKTKIAVCIGAEFKPEFLSPFFDIKDIQKFDITETVYSDITNHDAFSVNYEKGNIHVKAKTGTGEDSKETNRNYRIYKITEGGDSYYILNTHYRGSNRHPGQHFWPFEKLLIEEIKKLSGKSNV